MVTVKITLPREGGIAEPKVDGSGEKSSWVFLQSGYGHPEETGKRVTSQIRVPATCDPQGRCRTNGKVEDGGGEQSNCFHSLQRRRTQ